MLRLSVVQRLVGVFFVLLLSGVVVTDTEIKQVKPKNGKADEVRTEVVLPAALKSEERRGP